MKRYLVVSFIIHILPLIFMWKQIEKQTLEAELANGAGGTTQEKVETTGFDVQVIEQIPGSGTKKEEKGYYFGLGISGNYITTNMGQVYQIDTVYVGYNGEAAGLIPGDIITTVNGSSPAVNDISGFEPLDLTLIVVRANITLTILTKRGKVYF